VLNELAMNRPPYSSNDNRGSADPAANPLFDRGLDARHFTPRQLRLLRKEILTLRAAVERTEISEAAQELRGKLTRFGWVKWLLPRWTGIQGQWGPLGNLLKQYPMLSSLASMVISGRIRHMAFRLGRPIAKFGLVALAGWTIWQVWHSIGTRSRGTSEDTAAD
jgi:hypothetical protein